MKKYAVVLLISLFSINLSLQVNAQNGLGRMTGQNLNVESSAPPPAPTAQPTPTPLPTPIGKTPIDKAVVSKNFKTEDVFSVGKMNYLVRNYSKALEEFKKSKVSRDDYVMRRWVEAMENRVKIQEVKKLNKERAKLYGKELQNSANSNN